jgi:hypothetical protein
MSARKRMMHFNRHHLIPVSRCREMGIDPNFPGNVKPVKQNKHRAWHLLFGNATPEEAIEIIRKDWTPTGNILPFKRR